MLRFDYYEIHDWTEVTQTYHTLSSQRSIHIVYMDGSYYHGAIYVRNDYNRTFKWDLLFTFPKSFSIFYKDMYGSYEDHLFDSLEEAQQRIDKFLNRLVNLRVFL
jgi:hypothetical protein